MTPVAVGGDVRKITQMLIEWGLSSDQNFPSNKNVNGQVHINFSGYSDVSVALKNIPYQEIYDYLDKNRQFNVKLLDGGLLTFAYCFERNNLKKHRLCYYPSPSFEAFQNDPELYLDDSILYADVLEKSVLPVPVRFDYDPNANVSKDILHPDSHLTLGQYNNCRIPVKSPLCPSSFANFILQSFYHNTKYQISSYFTPRIQASCIKPEEEKRLHLSIA